ncbi:ALS2 C-terminal-like protein isoform X14 [Kogia breviceps]|uniref:ALS2 C-terminal-like protein isoform X14 n=1 Tax=Kogia breviceps TaxID=27615 RepID=UPI0034D29C44
MCSPEEAALLRLEEVFSATLARVNSFVLQPLLEAAPEPSDPWGRECLHLLQQLHRSSQQLWEVTEESLHSLQERLRHPDSISLESLLLLHSADRVLQVHLEYIESYTSCVAVQAFQKAVKWRSKYWQGQRKVLQQLLSGVSSEGSVGTALVQALRQPLTHHVHQYVLLLLSLGDTVGERHPTQELLVHTATVFGNLQSFMRQELDQAMATQALWHTLSNRLRDVLCTPAHRLLQDSQDIPVTVTPLRAERVLLFDDALVLLQGHSVHTFDLKLVWVEPGQDRCMFHILTPEEEFSLCSKDPQGRVAWQWKVTQAVCQTLRGKKDFPVLGAGLEPSEPPTCRCGAYTFRAEGRFSQATYEGEWYWGRPHGKSGGSDAHGPDACGPQLCSRGTLKWPDGQNHVGDFCQGLEHGFGIRLVPQASEDKFDCYKCHWREGSMCGYGICEYSTNEVYKGYFQEGLRHGFGVLESTPQTPQPCRYTGHWERGQRSGYGIEEDGDRGERYIGMWQADQRHGPGVMVTQAGFCYQGTFQADKMVGPGILLSEDDSLYEGTFTRDLTFVGKVRATETLLHSLLRPWPGSFISLFGSSAEGRWSRARSPSLMASPWRALLAVGQGEDCIPRVCWTQLPSLQIQAVPARGLCSSRLPWRPAGGPAGLPRAELKGAAQVPGVPVLQEDPPRGPRSQNGGHPGGAAAASDTRGPAAVPQEGPEQLSASPGKAAPDSDADLPGHILRHWGQQAPSGAGTGGGEAARPGTLGRLQGPAGAQIGATPCPAQLLLGALHSLPASS